MDSRLRSDRIWSWIRRDLCGQTDGLVGLSAGQSAGQPADSSDADCYLEAAECWELVLGFEVSVFRLGNLYVWQDMLAVRHEMFGSL